jgi:hypothetical protein
MTDDELEQERAELLAAIESGEPLTEDQKRRIDAVTAADLARPKTPFEQAFAETLAIVFDLSQVEFEPGKVATNVRIIDDEWREAYLVDLVTGEEVAIVGRFRLDSLLDREAEIAAERGN